MIVNTAGIIPRYVSPLKPCIYYYEQLCNCFEPEDTYKGIGIWWTPPVCIKKLRGEIDS